MRRRLQRRLRWFLALVLITFVVSFAAVQHSLDSRHQADLRVTHTLSVLNELETSLRTLREVEGGQRGVLLVDDDDMRKSLVLRRERLKDSLRSLRKRVWDHPLQQMRVRTLTELAEQYEVVGDRAVAARANSAEAFAELTRRRPGRLLTAEFERVIGEMRDEEQSLLQARREQARAKERVTLIALGVLGLFGCAIAISTFSLIQHHVSERERAETELRRAHAFLDAIVENLPNMLFVKEARNLTFLRLNRAGETLLGMARTELLGKNDFDLFPREQAEAFQAKDREVMRDGEHAEVLEEPIQTKHGLRWLRTHKVTLRDHEGHPEFLLGISEDITEAKHREDLLVASAERFRAVVEQSSEAILLCEPDTGRIIEANEAAAHLFRLPRTELLGKDRRQLLAPDDARTVELRAMRARTGKLQGGLTMRRGDGTFFEGELSAGTFRDSNGDERLTVFVRDVSARIAYEQSLLTAKLEAESASKELEAFCYSVSHDLRAPLRAIDGFSLALLEDCGHHLDEQGMEHLRRVRRNAQRMAQLIDDLLRLSRLSRAEVQRELVNVSQLASEVIHELAIATPTRQVEVHIAPGLQTHADPRLVRIAFENLLGNAWKFTSKQADARIDVSATVHEGKECFVVRDNGAGFEPAHKHRLFGAFQRLHGASEFEGSGIGLAIVLRVVERHGGRVWADSQPGQGASFTFSFSPERTGLLEHRHDGYQAHLAG